MTSWNFHCGNCHNELQSTDKPSVCPRCGAIDIRAGNRPGNGPRPEDYWFELRGKLDMAEEMFKRTISLHPGTLDASKVAIDCFVAAEAFSKTADEWYAKQKHNH